MAMAVGIARRVIDSRAYARIYAQLSGELVGRQSVSGTSTTTARLGMLHEIVEFFENSLPEFITSVLGLAGTILILSALNRSVVLGCLAVAGGTAALYALTGGLTTHYNVKLNDEQERQVDAVGSGDAVRVVRHIRDMMHWNIKLSDLEATNFGIEWLFMIGLLVFSIGTVAERTMEYGTVFAIVMYVFQFVQSVIMLPLYYQHWLRLREISGRLGSLEVLAS